MPMHGNNIDESCHFINGGEAHSFFIGVDDLDWQGTICLYDCYFKRCTFKKIGFIGSSEITDELFRQFRKNRQ
jgi:hypothetical protein